VAQDLGTAVLRLEVQTQEALQALNAFRGQVASALKDTNTASIFSGVEQGAKAAGEKAGRALTEGVKKATKELKFNSFQQALDFSPKNSIKGLEDYARALRNLRDKTDLGVAGTQQLTDRLGAVEAALRQAKQTTAQTAAEQKRFNDALDKVALQRFAEQARGFAAGLREQAKAAAANAEQFRRMRDQAEGAAKAIAGIAAKGVGEALKVPIFGLPKDVTSTFDKAKAQIERLQRQAETASGKVARLSEGIAVLGAGGVAAKGVIDTLGGIGSAASNTTGILSQVQQALESLPGPLKGLGGLDDLFAKGAQSVAEWSASILQAQGELSTLTAPLEAVTNSLSALGPEAAVVGGALAFTFAGFQDLIAKSFKPGIDGARAALKGMTADTQALLEALAAASEASKGIASLNDLRIAEKDAMIRVQSSPVGTEANLQASQELLDIQRRIKEELQAQFYQNQRLALSEQERAQIAKQLQDAAKPSGPLALPSSQMLNAEGRGIRRLAPDVGPAIDVGLQSARNFTAELLNAGRAGQQLPPIFGQVGSALQGLVDLTVEQTQGTKFQNELLQDQLELQQKLRATEEQRSRDARARLAQDAQARKQRGQEAGDLLVSNQNQRDFAKPATPGPLGLAAENIRKNGRSAVGNAVIGGAFPLLFGQGLGASLGGGSLGAVGGLAGGNFGFGLSLVGTALGTQVDEAVRKLGLLGSALGDPIGKFQELADAGLISSKALEKNIAALIQNGREAEAAARIQLDIAQQFGDTSELDELSSAANELQRGFASASVVLTKFVAGPLADFTRKIALTFSLIAQRGIVNERVSQLGLTDRQRTSIVAEARNNVGGDPTRLYEEVNRLLDERYGKTKQVLDAERLITEAQSRQSNLLSNSYRQIDADSFGNKRLKIEKEIEAIELRRKEALAVPGQAEEKIAQINRDAARDTYKLKQDTARLERDTWAQNIAAANQLKSIQEDIAIEQQRPSLTGTGIGALQAVKAFEDAKRAEQDAQAALRTAPGDNSLLNAAQLASEQVKLAAAKTKADLIDAFKSAQDSVRVISRGIEDTVTQLQQLQNTSGGGLNEFMSAQQVSDRQAALADELRPIAQEIANRRNLNFTLSGTNEDRNNAILRLIQADRQQTRLEQDLAQSRVDLGKAQNDLATINQSLVTVNTDLATATQALADKDWNVYVSVPGGSASGDVVREGVYQ
jgi:hypothetical protein